MCFIYKFIIIYRARISVVSDCLGDVLWNEDGSSWNGSDNDVEKPSDMDREWWRRRDQFHTVTLQTEID